MSKIQETSFTLLHRVRSTKKKKKSETFNEKKIIQIHLKSCILKTTTYSLYSAGCPLYKSYLKESSLKSDTPIKSHNILQQVKVYNMQSKGSGIAGIQCTLHLSILNVDHLDEKYRVSTTYCNNRCLFYGFCGTKQITHIIAIIFNSLVRKYFFSMWLASSPCWVIGFPP